MNRIKQFLTTLSTRRGSDHALLFMRIFAGAMMLTHGIGKMQQFDYIADSFPDPLGIGRSASLVMIIIAETCLSMAVITGLMTRVAALGLAAAMFVAAFMAFPDKSFADSELSFVYMGIFAMLVVSGGGGYSLDTLLFDSGR